MGSRQDPPKNSLQCLQGEQPGAFFNNISGLGDSSSEETALKGGSCGVDAVWYVYLKHTFRVLT